MTRTKIIAIAATLSMFAAPAFADTLKPLQGATFAIGSDHAVAYFTSESGLCNLVVTRAGEPDWNNGSLSTSRFEAKIQAGTSTRYDGSIDFACARDARTVLINQNVQVAASAAN